MIYESQRFISTISVLLTFAGLNQIIAFVLHRYSLSLLGLNFLPVVQLFVFKCWFSIFGPGMTRQRKALFNEANVLVTYQPRAYTEGILFVAETPTPAPDGKQSAALDAFVKARDNHYKDEFTMANQKTMETLVKPPKEKVQTMRIEFDETGSPKPPTDDKTSL